MKMGKKIFGKHDHFLSDEVIVGENKYHQLGLKTK